MEDVFCLLKVMFYFPHCKKKKKKHHLRMMFALSRCFLGKSKTWGATKYCVIVCVKMAQCYLTLQLHIQRETFQPNGGVPNQESWVFTSSIKVIPGSGGFRYHFAIFWGLTRSRCFLRTCGRSRIPCGVPSTIGTRSITQSAKPKGWAFCWMEKHRKLMENCTVFDELTSVFQQFPMNKKQLQK